MTVVEPGAPGRPRSPHRVVGTWLEGAQQPIVIWTDHKNLTYIRDAKRLGPRQACWALFFSRFTLTYRPDSKNVRADALSWLFPPETSGHSPPQDTIFPPDRVVSVVTWGIESAVRMAERAQPDPGWGPPELSVCPIGGPEQGAAMGPHRPACLPPRDHSYS